MWKGGRVADCCLFSQCGLILCHETQHRGIHCQESVSVLRCCRGMLVEMVAHVLTMVTILYWALGGVWPHCSDGGTCGHDEQFHNFVFPFFS